MFRILRKSSRVLPFLGLVATCMAAPAVASAAPVSPPIGGPVCQSGYLCLWSGKDFTGTETKYYKCGRYRTAPVYSFVNNPTGGDTAVFYTLLNGKWYMRTSVAPETVADSWRLHGYGYVDVCKH